MAVAREETQRIVGNPGNDAKPASRYPSGPASVRKSKPSRQGTECPFRENGPVAGATAAIWLSAPAGYFESTRPATRHGDLLLPATIGYFDYSDMDDMRAITLVPGLQLIDLDYTLFDRQTYLNVFLV